MRLKIQAAPLHTHLRWICLEKSQKDRFLWEYLLLLALPTSRTACMSLNSENVCLLQEHLWSLVLPAPPIAFISLNREVVRLLRERYWLLVLSTKPKPDISLNCVARLHGDSSVYRKHEAYPMLVVGHRRLSDQVFVVNHWRVSNWAVLTDRWCPCFNFRSHKLSTTSVSRIGYVLLKIHKQMRQIPIANLWKASRLLSSPPMHHLYCASLSGSNQVSVSLKKSLPSREMRALATIHRAFTHFAFFS